MKYIDISEHQGTIDFSKVQGNVDGVIIRAGYGTSTVDKQFVRNITECNNRGIPVGIYWFSYALSVEAAKNEALKCLEVIKKYKVELPVAWDYEYDSVTYSKKKGVTPTKQLVSDMCRAFCGEIEKAGYYAMNYTNVSFGNQYFDSQIFQRYDLWLAQWVNNWTESSKPQKTCGIWQWGGSAVPGITGNVDTNKSYRDYKTLIANAGMNNLTKEKTLREKAVEWAKENSISVEHLDDPVTIGGVIEMLYLLEETK